MKELVPPGSDRQNSSMPTFLTDKLYYNTKARSFHFGKLRAFASYGKTTKTAPVDFFRKTLRLFSPSAA